VEIPDDASLAAILQALGVPRDALVGHGGEARVFAIDDERVVRVLHPGGDAKHLSRRQRLVDELVRSQPRYALPQVLEVGELDGRVYAIERRLAGRSVLDELQTVSGPARRRLVEAHLDTAAALGDLHLEPRATYGDLISDEPIRAPTWRAYLEEKVAANLARSTPALRNLDPAALAAPFAEPPTPSFVHLDAFAGNMLTDGSRITAVIDIGVTSVYGDRRFDPLSVAAYLSAPAVTPMATPADADVAMGWLRNAGLSEWFEPVRRWLAAYWSFALDDAALHAWCHTVLR
jgi:aminoglycoside phosphotransferase (APT) family kinase protein